MCHPDARRARSVRSVIAAAAVGCATSVAARGADTYAIKLTRPMAVGQQFTVTCGAEVKQSAKVTVNGQAQQAPAASFKAEMTGTEQVDAINKIGGITKATVTIDKLTKDGAEVLPAGTVVTATRSGEAHTYTIDGAEVDAAKAAVLSVVIDVDRDDKAVTDDELLGTPDRQPVGQSWDGNPAKLATVLAEEQLPVTAEHLKVTSKLVEVKPVDGVPSEVIEMKVKADPLEVGKTLQGLTLTGGTFEAVMTQTLPVDPAGLAAAADEHVTFAFKGTANAGAVLADVTVDRTVHRTMTPKK